jgi:hypothetical protein
MMVNDLISLLLEVPAKLAAAWGVWFFAGLVLSIWQRREKSRLVVHEQGPTTKPKSGVRPPKPVATAPLSSGDAFDDLAALLDSATDSTAGTHRTPGDQLNEVTGSNGRPLMAAPQSLP